MLKIKYLLAANIPIFLLILNCAAQPDGATIQFIKIEESTAKYPVYKLIFKVNDKVIAKRFYQQGKTILKEGEIPKNIVNAKEIKLITEKLMPETKLMSAKEMLYLFKGKVIAKLIRQGNKFVLVKGEVPDGIIIDKYENGELRNVFINKGGMRNGAMIGFYSNGNVKIEGAFKNNFSDGITLAYYENGQKMYEEKFADGMSIYRKDYYENGNLKEEHYHDSIVRYYENGRKMYEEKFTSGKTISVKEFYENGNLKREFDLPPFSRTLQLS